MAEAGVPELEALIKTKTGQNRALQTSIFLGLGLLSIVFILPLFWMVSTSLKPIEETMKLPPTFIPSEWKWGNYAEALTRIPFFLYLKNTLIVVVLGTLGTVLSSSLVAYGFAHLRWPGRDTFFWLTLGTMMVPFPVLMVPLYSVFKELHWIGTLAPLWAPAWFGGAWNIFLMRQFFMGLPRELFEAARVDGASYFRMFRSVAVPLTLPALIVVFIFELKASWTDLMKPLIFIKDLDLFTLPLGLKSLVDAFNPQTGGQGEFHLVMAASVIITMPMVVIFFLAQRYFVEGIATTGSKG